MSIVAMEITKPTTAERLRIIQSEKFRIRRCMADEIVVIREKYHDTLTAIYARERYLKTKYYEEIQERECKE